MYTNAITPTNMQRMHIPVQARAELAPWIKLLHKNESSLLDMEIVDGLLTKDRRGGTASTYIPLKC